MIIFLTTVGASVLLAVCTAVKPICLQKVIDVCTDLQQEKILPYFAAYVASILGILLFEGIRQLLGEKYKVGKIKFLKSRLFERILQKSVRSFQEEQGQNYLTILNQEIDMLVENYYMQILDLTYSVLVVLTSVAALIYINRILAVLILAATLLPIAASALQGGKMQRRTNLYTESLEKLNVMIGNLISGFSMIKVNRAERQFREVLETVNQETAASQFRRGKARTFVNMLIGTLAYAGEVALVGVSVFLILRGKLSIGALIASLQLSEMLAIPTNNIAYQINDMNSVKGIKSKVFSLLAKEESEKGEKLDCPLIERIEFKDVSFSYEEKRILEKTDFCFEAGKKYLIVGENGSGKSTLFKLISKLETGYEGNTLLNGIDLRKIDNSFYQHLGIILQNTVILNDSLLNNITLYQSYPEENIREVLRSLGMDEFLESHDLAVQYRDTKDNFSGGEKQKIALSRLLIRDKKFILMDEATSAIDNESSLQIEKRLLCDEEITLIHIAHKIIPELAVLYDAIIEVKNAKLIRKTPEEIGVRFAPSFSGEISR